MELTPFLQIVTQTPVKLKRYPLIELCSKESPFFLFHTIKQCLKKSSLSVYPLVCDTSDVAESIATLNTSFLGQSVFYWLHTINALFPKKNKALLDFLQKYEGPHTVVLTSNLSSRVANKRGIVVGIPELVSKELLVQLCLLFDVDIHFTSFHTLKNVSVNQTCMFLYYLSIWGKDNEPFFVKWFKRLVHLSPSLFTLSQYFFAKNASQFFALWSKVKCEYGDQFWIAFWSDQLWRAHFYVQYSRAHKVMQAKKAAFRLPFSFIKSGWRAYESKGELSNAHGFLYEIDYGIKNGVAQDCLDLFYSKFFLNQFVSQKLM